MSLIAWKESRFCSELMCHVGHGTLFSYSPIEAALKFCKTCIAMKFVDDDDDDETLENPKNGPGKVI